MSRQKAVTFLIRVMTLVGQGMTGKTIPMTMASQAMRKLSAVRG